ncbi:hypothetical protein F5Y05DRAFT_418989 [Hypoxylon sp. FL0543]|nr:hypothetical protein F5Y05DRAFT_418989 [Hypoxylon sp. FL0543]
MSPDTTTKGPWYFITSCMNCFPRKQSKKRNPDFLAIRYNAKGAPMENHLPDRPLQLPLRVEYDPDGIIPQQPRRSHLASRTSSQFARDRPSSSSAAGAQQPESPIRMRQRFPVSNSNDPRDQWSKTAVSPAELAELFATIHTILEHVPYVICGLAALVDHGFTARRVTGVSLLCPAYAKDNVRAWLAARGHDAYADSVGIPVADGARLCRVRIKYTDEGFEKLERVRSSASAAWVLGLASQIDHAAAGYVDHWRRLRRLEDEGKSEGRGRAEQALQTIARDIFWCLDKAARTRHRLDPRFTPTLLGEEFWAPFTARHDEARTEMARAGIDVAGVLARQRAEAAVRDHSAMLKEFGFEDGGAVADRPGPFEGMRTLAHSRSVYTLKQAREGEEAVGGGDEEALPPLPAVVPSLPSPSQQQQQQQQQQPNKSTAKGKGKAKENKFLASLLPKRSNSARGSGAKKGGSSSSSSSSSRKDDGGSLGRSHSVRTRSRDPALVPLPRLSADAPRPPADWV